MLKLLLFQYRHLYSIVRKALLLLHSFPFLKEKFDHQVFMFLLRKFCLLFFQKSFIQVHSSVTLSKDHWRLDSQLILEDCSSAQFPSIILLEIDDHSLVLYILFTKFSTQSCIFPFTDLILPNHFIKFLLFALMMLFSYPQHLSLNSSR